MQHGGLRLRFYEIQRKGASLRSLFIHDDDSMGSHDDPELFNDQDAELDGHFSRLIVPFLASAFGVFLLRQLFMQLPAELFEAARIDGCGHARIFLQLVLPLACPALATLGVYAFLNTWNSYLWPLLVTNGKEMRTVQIGITMLQWEESMSWNLVLAGVSLVLLPSLLLLVFGLRQLVRGITAGAVKG